MDELNKIYSSCKKEMEKILKKLQEEIHRVRLGSKSVIPFLEKIKIKCYGTFLPLIEVSNITILDHMNISIQPWDRSLTSSIDKAIIDANLGFMPTNKGEYIHIHLPIVTEEGRKNLMKKIKKKTEQAKIFVRTIRKKNNQTIKKLNFSEDLSKYGETHIQKITSEYIQKIEDCFISKKKEIL
ncbi:MAG: ribosome recycling factor [Flavobacteriales bacterium]|jgi:ribosome recycling factor|uniref:ribosome recycling factor n=1 Tax=Blattabacterium sp. (Mastotermes darwiniensis) TaxID=39768 RepID=UPI000231DEDA|nr:ribosome recycling factor [Blattabacterium sp. (Mastotermes darwiniensis)]AER40782.1 ribosome recycling factor [Blattabacterium sp. (Mastotermes darwiniensis) str. MADAR]MDR1804627.1 ribosome recycling factor [Flavobacteriales bacterium]